MFNRIIGVDPGLSGALAIFQDDALTIYDTPTVEVKRGKKTKRELDLAALANIVWAFAGSLPITAYVERVGAMPGQGVTSMFSFGKSYGSILGILAACDVPVSHVAPNTWRGALQVRQGKDGSRLRASELMPAFAGLWSLKKHDGRAEAALIAYYGRQQRSAFA